MKNILYLLVTASLLAPSCGKTYQCKDQAGVITGEVSARSQADADSKCKSNGSQTAILKPKNYTPEPRVVPACETNATGTITFINKGKGVLRITVGTTVPAGFESVEPGESASATMPGGKVHAFTAESQNGVGGSGSGEFLVNTCEEHFFELAL